MEMITLNVGTICLIVLASILAGGAMLWMAVNADKRVDPPDPSYSSTAGVVLTSNDKLHFSIAMERVSAAKQAGLTAAIYGCLPDAGDYYTVATDPAALVSQWSAE